MPEEDRFPNINNHFFGSDLNASLLKKTCSYEVNQYLNTCNLFFFFYKLVTSQLLPVDFSLSSMSQQLKIDLLVEKHLHHRLSHSHQMMSLLVLCRITKHIYITVCVTIYITVYSLLTHLQPEFFFLFFQMNILTYICLLSSQ